MSTQSEALEAQVKEILDSNLGVFLGGIEGKDDAVRDIMGILEEHLTVAQCTLRSSNEVTVARDHYDALIRDHQKLTALSAAQCAPQPSGEQEIDPFLEKLLAKWEAHSVVVFGTSKTTEVIAAAIRASLRKDG
jgi:hypothetical protein